MSKNFFFISNTDKYLDDFQLSKINKACQHYNNISFIKHYCGICTDSNSLMISNITITDQEINIIYLCSLCGSDYQLSRDNRIYHILLNNQSLDEYILNILIYPLTESGKGYLKEILNRVFILYDSLNQDAAR